MSSGCGTLAHPHSPLKKGNSRAASGNGRQHTLPKSPQHKLIDAEDIEAHWAPTQSKIPTRLWGTTKATKYGGVERVNGEADHWIHGDFWNCDSNITRWSEHEVKRNAAAANHDVHRHDQIRRILLQHGDKREKASSVGSGGFDSSSRDRPGGTIWMPSSSCEHFRSVRSYSRNVDRLTHHFRSLRRSASSPGVSPSEKMTLRPEDVGGEAGELSSLEDKSLESAGRTHGSRSCPYWDRADHAVKREGARLSNGVHSKSLHKHPDGHPFVDNCELRPAAIYTRRFKVGGEDNLRKYEGRSAHGFMKTQ